MNPAKQHPKTPEDWASYVTTLSGEVLYNKARAANSLTFVKLLQEDLLEAPEITAVLRSFAERLVEDGQAPPGRFEGAYLDYRSLLTL